MEEHRSEDALVILCRNFNRLCNERQVSVSQVSEQTGLRCEMLQELRAGSVPDALTISDLEVLSNFFEISVNAWFDCDQDVNNA